MVSPNEISAGLDQFFTGSVMGAFMLYAGYIVLAMAIFGSFYILYMLLQYKYKVTYPILMYEGDNKRAKIIGYKHDRARTIKKKGVKKQKFLFKRCTTEPFTEDMIMPKNRVPLFRINEDGTFLTMPNMAFNSPASFEYISPEEKTWAIMELAETAQANEMVETTRKMLMYVMITIILCLGVAVLSIWLIMKAPQGSIEAAEGLTASIKNLAAGMGGNAPY